MTANNTTLWLTVNTGSSSLKLALFSVDSFEPIAVLQIESIGQSEGHLLAGDLPMMTVVAEDHRAAFNLAVRFWRHQSVLKSPDMLVGIVHRVVHGGVRFTEPTRITPAVRAEIDSLTPLAPLHNPLALQGMDAATVFAPEIPQFAVFDTAFHHHMPPEAFHYALPLRFYHEFGIRRYGFHGISVDSVSRQLAETLGQSRSSQNLIVAHLGNGASMTAIRDGRSVDTTMGFTPLEGLVMGTRAGDLDPAIPAFLEAHTGMNGADVAHLLNHDSGLKGLCGQSDLRAVHEVMSGGDVAAEAAGLALAIYIYRIRKYLGAFTALLGRVDAVIFTGGVGEHDAIVRAQALAAMSAFGWHLDPARNAATLGPQVVTAIHAEGSLPGIYVVPSREAEQMVRLVAPTAAS
ncbi:acetate/propionate family kinase [Halothiobacillus sp.]|uniref:acetate/propionate family kinase n=1 Tax=Halothiobacillus sp. TaxID=1891311 RepID=UPI002AD2351B|nr:acetate/propionate family kinase [Halothiobacillus sp.]